MTDVQDKGATSSFGALAQHDSATSNMVQKDDDLVVLNFHYLHSNTFKADSNIRVPKIKNVLRDDILSKITRYLQENPDNLINSCVLKIAKEEIDITSVTSAPEFDKAIELVLDHLSEVDSSSVVNVLVELVLAPQSSEDDLQLERSASPTFNDRINESPHFVNFLDTYRRKIVRDKTKKVKRRNRYKDSDRYTSYSGNLFKKFEIKADAEAAANPNESVEPQDSTESSYPVLTNQGSFAFNRPPLGVKLNMRAYEKPLDAVEAADPDEPTEPEDSSEPSYVGLVNQAMTCYLNSLLQALYMTPEFRNGLYNWEYKKSEKDSETSSSIPYQLQKLFLNLQTSTRPAVETTALTKSFGWDSSDSWHQHDIQELCRVMFDALEKIFKNTDQADLISRLYEGKIIDYVKCLTCNTEKSREDTFLDIPLPVRPFDTNVAYGSVEEALEAFVKYETLEGNNQYFCEKCDKKSNAHKGLKFTKFPYILTLQLKRFDFDQNTYHRIKLNDKVTFPDVLNLNSFIESTSNQESPSREEDAGMSAKCDDSCTTDNSTMDEECVPNDVTVLNSNHVTNHDQDDDEGIDVSNGGMSSSSCSAHNHYSEKLREEYAVAKGPYIYELFSIMIHSGSTSGGHYYAYIKDFRTNKWLCFNDQIVQHITHEDIQKTYGGGNRGVYYSGAYRSSTNAYMLMYRQIDPDRNTFAMKTEDFPPHIKDLLEKMKKNEDRSYHEEQISTERRHKRTIYVKHPATNNIAQTTLTFNVSATLGQLKEMAYSYFTLENYCSLDQCRIVTYFPKFDIIERTFPPNSEKMRLLLDLNSDSSSSPDLYLDIRGKNENFESYPSTPVVTKVYVIDALEKNVVDGPKYIRAYEKQTIGEYKQELQKHFSLDPRKVQLLSEDLQLGKLLENDFVFTETAKYTYKISATESYEPDMLKNLRDSVFYKMTEYLDDIVTFYIDTSEVTKEKLEKLKIPSLKDYKYRWQKTQENASSNYNCPTEELARLNMTSWQNKFVKNNDETNEDVLSYLEMTTRKENIQETSNSEDSSLSDSDRTLVGDVPEESELDCESALAPANVGNYPYFMKNKNDDNEIQKYFRIVQIQSKLWKVSMDERTTEEELKEKLEPYLEIPRDYFKILEFTTEDYKPQSKEDQKYSIHLGRVLNPDEKKVDIYILSMDSSERIRKLFTTFLKKNMRIGSAKHHILSELKRYENKDVQSCKWQFMEYGDGMVGATLSDDETNLSESICIQELPAESTFPDMQIIYLRKWNRSEMKLEDVRCIFISTDNFNELLKEKVSSIEGIPPERLEFTTLVARETIVQVKIESYEWKQDVKIDEIDLKTYLLYRDSRETPKILTEKERNEICFDSSSMTRRNRIFMGYNSSPRKEKALKIHVDST